MTKCLLSTLLLLTMLWNSLAQATEDRNLFPKENIYTLSKTYLFAGTSQQKFKKDWVAVLSDGSAWKIDPRDAKKYQEWKNGDVILPQLRTSTYWFKREHKFELHNNTRHEIVRTMLIQYATFPLRITSMRSIECGGHFTRKFKEDNNENLHLISTWEPNYKRYAQLNDGSIWEIEAYDYAYTFREGMNVYLGQQLNSSEISFFFITGLEEDAEWSMVKKIR